MYNEWLKIDSSGAVNVIELTLPEQVDGSEFDRLNEALAAAMEGKTDGAWLLDLSHVEYFGSAVLGLMVNLRQRIKTGGGKLVLCGMSARLTQVFQTCSLERLFVIEKGRPAAIKALS